MSTTGEQIIVAIEAEYDERLRLASEHDENSGYWNHLQAFADGLWLALHLATLIDRDATEAEGKPT